MSVKNKKISKETELEIIRLYDQGLSFEKIGKILDLSWATGAKLFKKIGKECRNNTDYSKNINLDRAYFDTINTEEKAYWLGFLFADGNVYKGHLKLALKSMDRQHIDKFKTAIGSNNKLSLGGYNRNGKYYANVRIDIPSIDIVTDLSKYNLIPKKSLVADPRLDLIDPELHRHFWRGMIDGDGCISQVKSRVDKNRYINSWYFTLCGSRSVIDKFQIFCNGGKLKPHRNIWYLIFCDRNKIANILDRLYLDSTVYLQRKYELYLKFKDLNP